MIYIKHDKLAIIKLKNDVNTLSFQQIGKALSECPANIIYCELNEQIYGIISTGDIFRAESKKEKYVNINKKFTSAKPGEYMLVRQMFKSKASINAIPVIDEKKKLLGAYIRCDDLLVTEYLSLFESNQHTDFWRENSDVALVKPCDIFPKKLQLFNKWNVELKHMGVRVEIIDGMSALEYSDKVKLILFTDEDEMLGNIAMIQTLLNKDIRYKSATYKQLYNKFVRKTNDTMINEILGYIKEKGAHILGLQINDDGSEYYQKLIYDEIPKKFVRYNLVKSTLLPLTAMEDFFEELYTKEYAETVASYSLFTMEQKGGATYLKDISSKYRNVKHGERLTIGQPAKYDRTIYFFGPCIILGVYVEDNHTIESFLQLKCNHNENKCKIVNLGCWDDEEGILQKIIDTPIKQNDIIVIYLKNREIPYADNLNLTGSLKKHNVLGRWFVDSPLHCNYKVNEIYADAIYEKLKSVLETPTPPQLSENVFDIDHNILVLMIQKYIERYFYNFDPKAYGTVGAIVMNCNPFTNGHRYLIEESLKAVGFLIIFVVEEDRSVFTFDERFAFVNAGVADLENVMVVPSGPFILSQKTFPEYFLKVEDEDIIKNVEYDITLFAEQISPRLNITYRFVGEEPQDAVTNQYNQAMKRILPKKGINIVEIPRKEGDRGIISASAVRKYLEDSNHVELERLIPKSTQDMLFIEER